MIWQTNAWSGIQVMSLGMEVNGICTVETCCVSLVFQGHHTTALRRSDRVSTLLAV